MWKQLFADADLLALPLASMLLFLALFAGILLWVLCLRRRGHYDDVARLPLERDDAPQEQL